MNKNIIGGIVGVVAIIGAAAYGVYDYKTTMYQCKKCKTLHRPTPLKWVIGMHTPGKRLLKCPKCEDTNWHERFVIADDRDFI